MNMITAGHDPSPSGAMTIEGHSPSGVSTFTSVRCIAFLLLFTGRDQLVPRRSRGRTQGIVSRDIRPGAWDDVSPLVVDVDYINDVNTTAATDKTGLSYGLVVTVDAIAHAAASASASAPPAGFCP
jgi:hypothetical protein